MSGNTYMLISQSTDGLTKIHNQFWEAHIMTFEMRGQINVGEVV
jgi:hypothetical protein